MRVPHPMQSVCDESRHLGLFGYGSDMRGSGVQRRTLTLAEGFAARGHRVDLVVVRADEHLRAQLDRRVRLVELRSWTARFGPTRLPWRLQVYPSVPALARYLRDDKPDVLMSTATHLHLAALWARRLA